MDLAKEAVRSYFRSAFRAKFHVFGVRVVVLVADALVSRADKHFRRLLRLMVPARTTGTVCENCHCIPGMAVDACGVTANDLCNLEDAQGRSAVFHR